MGQLRRQGLREGKGCSALNVTGENIARLKPLGEFATPLAPARTGSRSLANVERLGALKGA